jgi:hypothetical protein
VSQWFFDEALTTRLDPSLPPERLREQLVSFPVRFRQNAMTITVRTLHRRLLVEGTLDPQRLDHE